MVPDTPVKNTAGEEEIIHFPHLVNLRGCSAAAAFKGRRDATHRACYPTETSTTQKKHTSHPDPIPACSGQCVPSSLNSRAHPHHNKWTPPKSYGVTFLWLEREWRKGNILGFATTLPSAWYFIQKRMCCSHLCLLCGHQYCFQSWSISAQN